MSKPYKYSHEWSSEVVLTFYEKYVRATDLFAKIGGIETSLVLKVMTYALMFDNQVVFRSYKHMIKRLTHDKWSDYRSVPLADRRKYLHMCRGNAETVAIDELNAENGLDSQIYFDYY